MDMKYTIAREFKLGVSAYILREHHDWDTKHSAFLAGYKFASDNLKDQTHKGINDYLTKLGFNGLDMASVQSSNDLA